MSGTTAIASLPNNTQQLNNNVGINISEKVPQTNNVSSQVQMQNVINNQMNANSLDNIQIQAQPQQQPLQQVQPGQQSQQQLQQEMNTLVSNIQQASANGGTGLPSRDIPQNTTHLAIDHQVQQNNVVNDSSDYLKHMPNLDNTLENRVRVKNIKDNKKYILEEIQIPLLVSLLFVIFQMPVSKQFFKTNFKFLYNNENNYTLKGYIFMSVIFGAAYYIGIKLLDYLD
tara:strand:+ start:171 stop:854 length:684 start_codon:yes stop_codon:yes gene_type:complete